MSGINSRCRVTHAIRPWGLFPGRGRDQTSGAGGLAEVSRLLTGSGWRRPCTRLGSSPATNFQLSAFSLATALLQTNPDKTCPLISRAVLFRLECGGRRTDVSKNLTVVKHCANRRWLSREWRNAFPPSKESPTCAGNFRYHTTNTMCQKSYYADFWAPHDESGALDGGRRISQPALQRRAPFSAPPCQDSCTGIHPLVFG